MLAEKKTIGPHLHKAYRRSLPLQEMMRKNKLRDNVKSYRITNFKHYLMLLLGHNAVFQILGKKGKKKQCKQHNFQTAFPLRSCNTNA